MSVDLEQRRLALAGANRIRLERASIRAQIKDGTADLPALIREPPRPLHSMRTETFLTRIPGIGAVKARRLLSRAQIAPTTTLLGLTARQRDRLTQELSHRG